jgi:GNAT superfamily N-acetyltransferase
MSVTATSRWTAVCERLDWDSAFFGHRIARFRKPQCLRDDAAALLADCAANGIDCAYILADVADTESIAVLQETRAYLADVRVTFGTRIESAAALARPLQNDGPVTPMVRSAAELDIPALMRIASVSHRDTRFYADRHFDPARCNRLYEVWIENSCRGYADAVFVANGEDGQPSGYVTCHKDEWPRGHIGLFAVSEGSQGRGYGKALIEAASTWFSAHGVSDMTVATQLRNVRALQFYAGAGLLIRSVGLWFHLWPGDRIGERA